MNNVIGFFGADHKVGTTMIAQSVANILKKRGKKVFIVHFDGGPGTEYIGKHTYNIDSLKPHFSSGILTVEDIYNVSYHVGSLYSLEGLRNLRDIRKYTDEHGKKLLDVASCEFEYVIVDAGRSSNGLTVAALRNCDSKILVTTQQKTVYRNYQRFKAQILDSFNPEFEQIIVNKFSYVKGQMLPSDIEVAQKYGFEDKDRIVIPLSPYSMQAEEEERPLLELKDKDFTSAIDKICDNILGETEEESSKSHIFGLFGK